MQEFIGKTVKTISIHGVEGFDDKPIMKIIFTDGTTLCIKATYGGYTGESLDEYPTFINHITCKDTVETWGEDASLYTVEEIA